MRDSSGHPRIGISVGAAPAWQEDGEVYRSYAAAIEGAGGAPVSVGLRGKSNLEHCEGLMVPGGWDVHPSRYDPMPGDEHLSEDEYIRKYKIEPEPERDAPEFALIREALGVQKPILAICRGIQSLNVVLCRKLIPDIARCVPGAIAHDSPESSTISLSHEVAIEPGSLIERVYGTRTLVVNTRHHQGMTADMVPDCLRYTAIAPDGVVEAVESSTSEFIVGAQWHPERERDEFIHQRSGPLFEAFVRACKGEQIG